MKLKNLIFLLAAFPYIIGCNTTNHCEKKLAKLEMKCPSLFQLHDTVIYKTHDTTIIVHDTFTIPSITGQATFNVDSLILSSPIKEIKNDTSSFKGYIQFGTFYQTKRFKGGSATIKDSNGVFTVKCHEDSLKVACTHKDSIITCQENIIKTGIATKTITTNVLTGFQTFCYWFFILLLAGTCIYFCGKYVIPLAIKAIKPKL